MRLAVGMDRSFCLGPSFAFTLLTCYKHLGVKYFGRRVHFTHCFFKDGIVHKFSRSSTLVALVFVEDELRKPTTGQFGFGAYSVLLYYGH